MEIGLPGPADHHVSGHYPSIGLSTKRGTPLQLTFPVDDLCLFDHRDRVVRP